MSVNVGNKSVTLNNSGSYGMANDSLWKGENLLSGKSEVVVFINYVELDHPGEYYVLRSEGLLFLYPPYPLNASSIVIASTINNLFDIQVIFMHL